MPTQLSWRHYFNICGVRILEPLVTGTQIVKDTFRWIFNYLFRGLWLEFGLGLQLGLVCCYGQGKFSLGVGFGFWVSHLPLILGLSGNETFRPGSISAILYDRKGHTLWPKRP